MGVHKNPWGCALLSNTVLGECWVRALWAPHPQPAAATSTRALPDLCLSPWGHSCFSSWEVTSRKVQQSFIRENDRGHIPHAAAKSEARKF